MCRKRIGGRNVKHHPISTAEALTCLAIAVTAFATACLSDFEKTLWTNTRPADWIVARNGNFSIVSNADSETAIDFAEQIELLRSAVRKTTNFESVDARVPTRLFLFDHIFGAEHFLPRKTIGVYIPTLRGAYIVTTAGKRATIREGRMVRTAFKIPENLARSVVLHEYTHLLMHNDSSSMYPKWYDEGMAEMLGNVSIRDGNVEIGQFPKDRRAALGERLPLVSVLTTRNFSGWTDNEISSFYTQSWVLVNMLHAGHLVGGPNRNRQMRRFLSLTNDGLSVREASLEAFGVSVWVLQEEYLEYVSRKKYPYLKIPVDEFTIESAPEFRAWPRRDVQVALGDLSLSLGLIDQARVIYERAVSGYSGDPAALAGLAVVYMSEGRFEEAAELTTEAEAIGPDDAAVVTRLGEALLIRTAEPSLTDDERGELLLRARGYLDRGIELAPGSPGAYALKGMSYIGRGSDVEPGIVALERAREIFPANTPFYLFLGELYVQAGMADLARQRLEVVENWSHGGSELERASSLLADLRSVPESE